LRYLVEKKEKENASGTFYAPVPIFQTATDCLDRLATPHGNLPRTLRFVWLLARITGK